MREQLPAWFAAVQALGNPTIAAYLQTLLRDGRFLGCEVKGPTGKLRPEQSIFLERIRGAGGVAFLARDLRDVMRELNQGKI